MCKRENSNFDVKERVHYPDELAFGVEAVACTKSGWDFFGVIILLG